MESFKTFKPESTIAAADIERQSTLDDNITRYNHSLNQALPYYSNLELAKKRAGYIRYKAINGLEKYLVEFEFNFERNGGKVIWAQDDAEAIKEIISILNKNKISEVVKSRSSLADEIDLASGMLKENIRLSEINPGEFILSQFEEKQRHLSSVTIHKRSQEISELFNSKFGIPLKHNPADILSFIRSEYRNRKEQPKAAILGANYLISDTGSVCISEDSGDSVLNSIQPRIQIILAGIDKIIPSISNLDTFLSLYSTFSNGEKINAINTIISGPKLEAEKDGPQEMYLVLIDNGRSKVLAQKYQRRALSCIDCGACQNVCPVYRKIGGVKEVNGYTGPIGSVTTPWIKGIKENIHLSYASTLCGKCTEICPVGINIHELLIFNRNSAIKLKEYSMSDNLLMKGWHRILVSRKNMDRVSSKWKNIILNKIYAEKWGNEREMPQISAKSFKQLWEERREGKK